jgi:cyclopropane-fatty-acyl-phospholipid synthase
MLAFGEAFMNDFIDFEGSFDEIMAVVEENKKLFSMKGHKLLKSTLKKISRVNIKEKQKENIQHHYDLGNDFFSLWLDETLSYSCAYFKNPTDSLYEAQMNKIDLVLKKLQLKPGEKLLDIGCGWGWLIISAAQNYGVKATGINISKEQYLSSTERIRNLGLSGQVDVKLLDYLDLDTEGQQFDKIVSVGMFEHVGRDNLHKYLERIQKVLVPGGLSLLHSIMGVREDGVNSWTNKYIFPGGYIPSFRETISLLPEYDFHLLHAESLRMHYALTLDHWCRNYEKHWDTVEGIFGRKFARMWQLYLKASASSFRAAGLDIYQLVFSKGLSNNLYLTLDRIYS